mmetsp:Transcript_19624/g.32982  ORF Transcript_19624/g.32982 Transcript_19624/m.32982 type:complete len:179 (-) Transcript_19624:172-708(-)|eukprot:CAMPEP_0198210658 /NCGR_PEP_ID=MMETSP1445-20131203/21454_1 /TAXON_ID=36898 /ORGANISM="Pyramimonas sp., Strain CCMP2087" /LENGTH=178 /DNA_ID=CAMNT_0043884777 /DNA_START=187 /DNA_END=723 /DNA_ORIENTATION=+
MPTIDPLSRYEINDPAQMTSIKGPLFGEGKPPSFLGGLLVGEGHYIKPTLPYLTMFPELNTNSPLLDPTSPIRKRPSKFVQSTTNFVTSRHELFLSGGNRHDLVEFYHKKANDQDLGLKVADKVAVVGFQKFQSADRERKERMGRRPCPLNYNKVSVWTLDHEIVRERKRELRASSFP